MAVALFHDFLRSCKPVQMPRKGWSTDGWLQVIRGPRPQSNKWPTRDRQSSKPPAKGCRGSQVTPPPEASRRGPLPEEVVSIARERVMKLEAAMAAVGKSDPTFSHLHDALKKAKAQCQVRSVEDRIAASKEFIERAKKRIVACQAEVSQEQEALAKVQSKLQFEKQSLADGEARLAALIQESAAAGPRVEEVPATLPANFAHELQELRACLSELRQENTELRAQLQSGRGEERERKHPRSLVTSSLELAPLSRAGAEHGPGVGQSVPLMGDAALRMETLIDNAEASLRSNRFNPLSG